MTVREITAKNIVTKSDLPVCDYSLNPYVGCEHACRYCYACFMKRFTGHTEEWGEFLDVKSWEPISRPEKYAGKEIFIGSVTDPYQPAEKAFRRTPFDPIRKIYALWSELRALGAVQSTDKTALDAFVKKYTGIDSVQWLLPDQQQKIIEILKQWIKRIGG